MYLRMIFFVRLRRPLSTSQKAFTTQMSFAWVLLAFCVVFAGPISAADDQEVVWSYSNPDIDLYDDEALVIRWSSYHDVWSHSPSDDPDCAKASVVEKAAAMDSSWRAEAGTLASPGTHYFSCQFGGHCNSGMKVKVTRKTGSRDAATSPCERCEREQREARERVHGRSSSSLFVICHHHHHHRHRHRHHHPF